MKRVHLATLISALALSATPAIAQEGFGSSAVYDRYDSFNYDPAVSMAGRFRDYRQFVAKKTYQDGGTLTSEDKAMLTKRYRQLVSEAAGRRNPEWTAPWRN